MASAAARRGAISIRQRLLNASRGLYLQLYKSRPLKVFSLLENHLGSLSSEPNGSATPHDFHTVLCDRIRKATKRVYLASLYIGPAACPESAPHERELLEALQHASSRHVPIRLLMDQNRALRPVPLSNSDETTSSAQAVHDSLQTTSNNTHHSKLFLFPMLKRPWNALLKNPYNEIAGVFHIKAYVVDDALILSGANLSEEYFTDRHDRYWLVEQGGAGLVDFYVQLIDCLCQYSHLYSPNEKPDSDTRTSRPELLEALTKLFTTTHEDTPADSPEVVAHVVPTFQAPTRFFSNRDLPFLSDVESTRALLQEANRFATLKLSSAYLNPTPSKLKLLRAFTEVVLMTAGRISHGFAPRRKAGNQGRDWIPTLFELLSRSVFQQVSTARLLYYERPGWTFHAKGLWLEETTSPDSARITNSLLAALVGSSNFGARSERLDMESNCWIVVPQDSPLQKSLTHEWNDMCRYTHMYVPNDDDNNKSTALPNQALLQLALPIARRLF